MSQRAVTGGTGASNQEETTAFESSTQVKFGSECSKGMFGSHNGRQYCNCKRYSSLMRVPALLKKIRRDPHQFVKKGREAGASVKEWEADDLASISDDKRGMYKSKKRVEWTIPGG